MNKRISVVALGLISLSVSAQWEMIPQNNGLTIMNNDINIPVYITCNYTEGPSISNGEFNYPIVAINGVEHSLSNLAKPWKLLSQAKPSDTLKFGSYVVKADNLPEIMSKLDYDKSCLGEVIEESNQTLWSQPNQDTIKAVFQTGEFQIWCPMVQESGPSITLNGQWPENVNISGVDYNNFQEWQNVERLYKALTSVSKNDLIVINHANFIEAKGLSVIMKNWYNWDECNGL